MKKTAEKIKKYVFLILFLCLFFLISEVYYFAVTDKIKEYDHE